MIRTLPMWIWQTAFLGSLFIECSVRDGSPQQRIFVYLAGGFIGIILTKEKVS